MAETIIVWLVTLSPALAAFSVGFYAGKRSGEKASDDAWSSELDRWSNEYEA